MINIKSDREIELMRHAGRVLGEVHNEIGLYIKPGITTYELDEFALRQVKKRGCEPSFYHLYNFPGHFCISINDELIHGIPSKHRYIKEGDVVKIDGGVCYKGFHSDAARTHIVGKVDDKIRLFVERTRQSFFEGIKMAVPNNHINDISKTIDYYITSFGYGVVEEYVGHGIGSDVHEDPEVPNYETVSRGPKLCKNMTLAVEPMANMGDIDVYTCDDEWTVKSKDGSMTAHYENTILITDNGPEILSLVL